MRDIVVLLTMVLVLPIAFVRAYIGVLLWAWTALIAPNYYVYGFLSSLQFNKVISFVTLAAVMLSREPKRITWNFILGLILALFVQGTISYLLSGNNNMAFDIFNKFWKECVLCILINMLITDRLRLHSLLGMTAIALGFHGVIEGLKFIETGGAHHNQGLPTLGDNNQFALAMLMIAPLMYYLARHSAHVIARWAWLIGTVLTCIAVVSTWSRGGFVGMAAIGLALVVTSRTKIRSLIMVSVIGAAVMSIAPPAWYQRLDTIESAEQDDSFMGRVTAWEVSYQIAMDHPLFGGGFHAVQDSAIWHAYAPRTGMSAAFANRAGRAAHSIYFEILGDLGFVGLAIFMALLFLGFQQTGKAMRLSKGKEDLRWIYDLALMFRVSLIGYMVSGALLSMAYFEFFYIMLSMIGVLAMLAKRVDQEARAPAAPIVAPLGAPRPAGVPVGAAPALPGAD